MSDERIPDEFFEKYREKRMKLAEEALKQLKSRGLSNYVSCFDVLEKLSYDLEDMDRRLTKRINELAKEIEELKKNE